MKRQDPNSPDSATSAYLRGMNNDKDGLFWLQRAHRLMPQDPRIMLEIANRELSDAFLNLESAYQKFLQITQRYDIAPAWIGLAIAAQALKSPAIAASAIEALLTRHCLPEAPDFRGFARHIALIAGYGGWQGVQEDGTIIKEGERHLLGAKPDFVALNHVEGVVAWRTSGLYGWAVRPAWPDYPPMLELRDATGRSMPVKCGKPLQVNPATPFLPRYRFAIPLKQLAHFVPPFQIYGPNNKPLLGSPLNPEALQAPPIAADLRGQAPALCPAPAPLALIMPVYRGFVETKAAIQSVRRSLSPDIRFIVVNDASPEPDLCQWLEDLAQDHKIELIQHPANQGFCAAVNSGLKEVPGHDVLLLNSDILVSLLAIQTMRQVAYLDAAIGTVTPFSNEATICSYPNPQEANPMPDLATTDLLDKLANQTNGLASVEIPTGVGFCLYIRHDCLAQTGTLRQEIYAQGYGEENDFCLRARHSGYKHVAAMGAYVAHKGGVSFKAGTQALIQRNSAILEQLFPGYQQLVRTHHAHDPMAPYRKALDKVRLLEKCQGSGVVLFISHAHGGGVAKQVEAIARRYEQQNIVPLILTTQPPPAKWVKYPWPALLSTGIKNTFPNLVFKLPHALDELLALLKQLHTNKVELHHTLGHHPVVHELAGHLGVAQDIVVHDYASFCPRVNLLTKTDKDAPLRYCGEPNIAGCKACLKHDKAGLFETLPLQHLLARSMRGFSKAEHVIVPSQDVAKRLLQHFPGIQPQVTPWEDDQHPFTLRQPRSGARRIAIIGGIGPAKGYDIVLDCAWDAKARQLPLEFIVIGSTADDNKYLEAGIKVTGAYKPEELEDITRELAPDLAFLPSICPETWGFVLSEAWQLGLYTVVFDLGTQAQRVRATSRGAVLPLGLPADRTNNTLLNINF